MQKKLNLEDVDCEKEDEEEVFLKVQKLQCMKFIKSEMIDMQNIRTNLERAQIVFVEDGKFGIRTIRGVSFSIKKGEQFAILGDKDGVNDIIRTIMGFKY